MSETIETAKVFMSGRSQAVRLPKSCRFDTAEVRVQRIGDTVVLTPLDKSWAAQVDEMFAAAAELAPIERPEQWPQPEREPLLP